MSARGRPALPANVHVLRGNPSKLSAGQLSSAVTIPVALPACPAFLGDHAKREWRRIAEHLVNAGLVTHLDRALLAAYCQAWGEWAQLNEHVKTKMAERGVEALTDSTPSGYRQIAVVVQARDRAFDRMVRVAREFGLSPASRVQSTAGQQLNLPGMPEDPMESFLQAGSAMPTGASGAA